MRKTKTYCAMEFPPSIVHSALGLWMERARCDEDSSTHLLSLERGNEEWRYDSLEQFFSAFDGERPDRVYMDVETDDAGFCFHSMKSRVTSLSVTLETRAEINGAFQPFEDYVSAHPDALSPEKKKEKPTVFIGHGRSVLWRDLKDHLQDKHGYNIEAYETGARAGHSVRDVLQEMLDSSSFALLVITAEDETAQGSMRARQNVVHELGLFQGRLGFSKAVAIVEDGVEMSSNMESIQQIRFGAGNIRETFGEVVATLEDRTTDRSRR